MPADKPPAHYRDAYHALVCHALNDAEAEALHQAMIDAIATADVAGVSATAALDRIFRLTRRLTDGKLTRAEVLTAAEQVALEVAAQGS